VSGVRRLILSGLLCTAASGVAAQSVVAPPPPARPDTVGPEQLRDFSLGGNRQGAEQPAPTAPTGPAPAATATLPPATREATPGSPAPTAERPAAQRTEARPAPAVTRPAREVTVALPQPRADTPAAAAPTLPDFGFSPATPSPAPGSLLPPPLPSGPPVVPADEGSRTAILWPLLALLAALGGGLLWWLRRNRSEPEEEFGQLAFAGAPASASAPAPSPRPAPPPVARSAAPPAATPQPAAQPAPRPGNVGVVSSRLRAWLDLDVGIRVAAMTTEELQLEVDILLTNSGSAPAREIAVEALLLNAGPEQETELAHFYARPEPEQQSPDAIAPMGQLALSATLKMSRVAFREYAAGTGKVMVPVVALSAGYKAGGSRGRTSGAFLVGRGEPGAEKLAPLPTDQGAKGFARLAARRLPGGERR